MRRRGDRFPSIMGQCRPAVGRPEGSFTVSRSLSRAQALLLGLVVLTGLALGGWILFRVGDRQRLWAETVDVYAGFASANGIDKGTPVRVRGVEAGQVVAIDLPASDDLEAKVRVRLRLDRKFLPLLCADARARLMSEGVFGGRVINIEPGKDRAHRLNDGDEIAVLEAQDLSDVMQQVAQTVKDLRDSNGSVMKLLKSDEAHTQVVGLAKDTREMVKQGQETIQKADEALDTLKRGADAITKLPGIRGYVSESANALLYRPDADSDRRIYATVSLFEPGRAVLTEEGKMHLNNLASWFKAFNQAKVSDAVVVTYSSDSSELTPSLAQMLTQRQSEAVVNYLRDAVRAHRTGWFGSRKVTPLGMGMALPPAPDKDTPTHSRTEIIVFTPR